MIEKIVLDWLTANMTVPVYAEKPEDASESYLVVNKTGSSISNHIKSATITVQSYAPSKFEAAELNELVKTAMDAIVALTAISRCQLNSDYSYPDTTTKEYRYQAVFDIVHF